MKLAAMALIALGILPAVGSAQPPQRPQQPGRAQLEGEVRRDFARMVRERVGLSEPQMRELGPITQRHERQRRQLQMQERRARMSLQTALRAEAPDTAHVSRLLDSLVDVQRRRVQLVEAEHRDLAAVMTPVQRARYLALQEQVRRRVEQMRQRPPGGDREGPPGRRGPPPG